MKISTRDELSKELQLRGFAVSGASPNDTMVLDQAFLDETDIIELLDSMVTRREKVFRSQDVVGSDAAKKSYDDVVLVIEAIKSVIAKRIR